MSDDTDATGTDADDTDTQANDDNPKPSETVDFWKQKARDQEKRAKANADAAQRLQQLEDEKKSDVDRLTEQVATLTQERDSAVSKADRLEVAVLKSLDEDKARRITSAAKRLTGTTREELEADADEFLTAFAPQGEDRPTPPGGKPREQLKPGSTEPDTPVEETDIKKLGERMFAS